MQQKYIAAMVAAALANGGGNPLDVGLTFFAPLTTSIVATRATGSPTFTRATTATVTDWEGTVRNVLSGEVRFQGARRVQNLVSTTSENFGAAQWVKGKGGTGTLPTVTSGFADPDGGTNAFRVQADRGASNTLGDYSIIQNTLIRAVSTQCVHSIWAKSNTGVNQTIVLRAVAGASVVVGPTWQRVATGVFNNSVFNAMDVGTCGGAAGGQQTVDVLIYHAMAEDVIGQSNQNPSEYVSKGVLSAPYQGANVDGVKYFGYQNGNTVASNVVTEATGAQIPLSGVGFGFCGQDGTSKFTLPDAAGNRLTGDFDIRVWAALPTWTPAVGGFFITKNGGGGNFSWMFGVQNTGVLVFQASQDGTTAAINAFSSVATGFTAYTAHWVRVTRSSATGSVTFYTSDDGVTWTQLGTVQAAASGALSPGGTPPPVAIGARGDGASPVAFYPRQVSVYGNIGASGTPAINFNASDWVSGATFADSQGTGTWTLNGGAKVNKFPLAGYLSEQQSTNLVLQSENFGTTWVAVGTPTRVAAALRCGNVVLDQLSDADAGTLDGYSQTITFTGNAVKAVSFLFAQGTATQSWVDITDSTAVATRLTVNITWTNGIPTCAVPTGTLLGVDPLGGGVFRCRVLTAAITAANVNSLRFFPASVQGTIAPTGNAYFGGVQAEDNANFCTSYIPTTTVAVTRNVDLLVYPLAGNVSDTAGSTYAEVQVVTGAGANTAHAIGAGSGAASWYSAANTGGTVTWSIHDGTAAATVATADITTGVRKVATKWDATGKKVVAGGVAGVANAYDGSFGATAIQIGQAGAGGGNALNGTIRNVKIWQRALTDAELQALTT